MAHEYTPEERAILDAAGVTEEPRRRWWWVGRDGRYEVEIVAWWDMGAIILIRDPFWDGVPIHVKLSELWVEEAGR